VAYFGFLNINKPSGVTSRWVVDRVQRLVRPDKAGHAGTLDPLATGVLVVAVGQATRLIEYVQRMNKRYRGTFLLGRSSDTEDIEGTISELPDPPIPTLAVIQSTAAGMIGEIQQRPPAYSAIKVAGQRSYDLARAGKQVELATRPVQIHSIEVVEYAYPQLVLDVECGGGTYVRTLGRDLAERCGTSAVMSALTRTAVGEFTMADAITIDSLTQDLIVANLLSPLKALGGLPSMLVNEQDAYRLANGLAIAGPDARVEKEVTAIDTDGNLIAVLERSDKILRPMRVFRP
jgi:tRNA pseudouridine55 synthase